MDLQTLSAFELRQICYFMTVVKSGNNLTQAANRLGIKQPPLTQSIKALEKLLSGDPTTSSVELFDRSTRPLRLTEAGQAFLEEAELALTHLERAISKARLARQGQFGRLVVGLNNAIANSILPEVLKEIPLEYLVLETDAPYLPPVPHRGKRNESAYVRHVAEMLSEIKVMPLAEIARVTTENALRMFG